MFEKVKDFVKNIFGYNPDQEVTESTVDGIIAIGHRNVKEGSMKLQELKELAAAYVASINAGKALDKKITNGIKRDHDDRTETVEAVVEARVPAERVAEKTIVDRERE